MTLLVGGAYHYVRPSFDAPYPGIHGVTPDRFAQQMKKLAEGGRFASASDVRRWVESGEPPDGRNWLITFDDGLREQYEYAWPVLKKLGIPAIFFINTEVIRDHRISSVHKIHLLRSQFDQGTLMKTINGVAGELDIEIPDVDHEKAVKQYFYDTVEAAHIKYLLNFGLTDTDREIVIAAAFEELTHRDEKTLSQELYMTPDQINDLTQHGAIGTHAHHHRPLGLMSDEDVRHQIRESLDVLEGWTGVRVDNLSYPYGSRAACSSDAGRIAEEEGIKFAFTMERAGIRSIDNKMFLPRCAENDLPGGTRPRWDIDDIFENIPNSMWYLEKHAQKQFA